MNTLEIIINAVAVIIELSLAALILYVIHKAILARKKKKPGKNSSQNKKGDKHAKKAKNSPTNEAQSAAREKTATKKSPVFPGEKLKADADAVAEKDLEKLLDERTNNSKSVDGGPQAGPEKEKKDPRLFIAAMPDGGTTDAPDTKRTQRTTHTTEKSEDQK
ncbi:unnamed protein product, partial [Mesorhabditis spiculigera]